MKNILKKALTVSLILLMTIQTLPLTVKGEYVQDNASIVDSSSNTTHPMGVDSGENTESTETLDTKETIKSGNQSYTEEGNNKTETFVSSSSKRDYAPELAKSLVVDISDNMGKPIDGIEFKLVAPDSTIKTSKSVGGLLVFKDLKKGEYTLESVKELEGYDKKNIRYNVIVSGDSKLSVKDISNNKDISVGVSRENIIDNNFVFSSGVEKVDDGVYRIPLSIQISNNRIASKLKVNAELNNSFIDGNTDIKNSKTVIDSNMYTISDMVFDSNKSWSGSIMVKLNNNESDNDEKELEVKKIFENIYISNDTDRIVADSPRIYMQQPVENARINITLNKIQTNIDEVNSTINEPNSTKYLAISPRMARNAPLEMNNFLVEPMLANMMEGVAISLFASESRGTLIIDKTDNLHNPTEGKPLSGAVFNLKGVDDITFDMTLGENEKLNKFIFSDLKPGTYLLSEKTAPPGYKKSEKTWYVYVRSDGNVRLIENQSKPDAGDTIENNPNPTDISSGMNIVSENIRFNTNATTLTKNSQIVYNLSVRPPTNAKPGDYFYLDMSDTLVHNQVNPDKEVSGVIRDSGGRVVAIWEQSFSVKDSTNKYLTRIKYTLVEPGNNILEMNIQHSHSIRLEEAKYSGTYDYYYKLGSHKSNVLSGTLNYPEFSEGSAYYKDLKLNVAGRVYRMNDTESSYTSVYYINPKQSNYNGDGAQLTISPIENRKSGEITINSTGFIRNGLTDVKVYKYKRTGTAYDAVINPSVTPDFSDSGLVEITNSRYDSNGPYVESIKIDDGANLGHGTATVKVRNIGDYSIVVVSKSYQEDHGTFQLAEEGVFRALNSSGELKESGYLSQAWAIGGYSSSSSGSIVGSDTKKLEYVIGSEVRSAGKVILYKVGKIPDKGDEYKPLGGAKFKISGINTDGSNKSYSKEAVSDQSKGKIVFGDLEPGKYKIEEIQAPVYSEPNKENIPYKKTSETWTVTVDENGSTSVKSDSLTPAVADKSWVDKFFELFDQSKKSDGFLIKRKIEAVNPTSTSVDGYMLKQTIEPTGSPSKFKVTGEVIDTRDNLEMVIVIDKTIKGVSRVGDDDFYKEKIRRIADKLRTSNPKSKITVIGANQRYVKTYVSQKSAKEVYETIMKTSFDLSEIKWERTKLKNAYDTAADILSASKARKKSFLHISGYPFYDSYTVKETPMRDSLLTSINRMKANGTDVNAIIEVNPTNSRHYNSTGFTSMFDGGSVASVYEDTRSNANGLPFGTDSNFYQYDNIIDQFTNRYAPIQARIEFGNKEGLLASNYSPSVTDDGSKQTLSNIFRSNMDSSYKFSYDVDITDISKIPTATDYSVRSYATLIYDGSNIQLPMPAIKAPNITMEVKKVWKNTPANEQLPVTIKLIAKTDDGQDVKLSDLKYTGPTEFTLNGTEGWRYNFEGLPQFTSDFKRIVYSLKEVSVNGTNTPSDFDVRYFYSSVGSEVINSKVPNIVVPNEQLLAKFDIKKVSLIDGKESPLANAEFEMEGMPIMDPDGKLATEHKIAKSGKNGEINFTDIRVPSYWYLRESKTPLGFESPNAAWIVHFIEDSTRPEGYKVNVYKTGLETLDSVLKIAHPTITNAWVDGNSQAYKDFIAGKTDTVTGATIKPKDLNNYLKPEDQIAQDGTDTYKIQNEPLRDENKGNVVIYKTEEGNPTAKLSDAMFELRTENRERIINSKKTDSSGEVRFEGLLPGTYYLKEILAPQGYNIDDTEWKVVVDSKGHTKVYKPAIGTSYTPNANSVQKDDYDERYDTRDSYGRIIRNNTSNIRSRIVDVNYETGKYTQFIYVNTSGDAYQNYKNQRRYSPKLELSLPFGTSANTFSTTNTRVDVVRVSSANLSATIPLNATLPTSIYKTASRVTMSGSKLEVDFANDFDKDGYAAVVKVTSKFDKASLANLDIKTDFTASNAVYKYYSNDYTPRYASTFDGYVTQFSGYYSGYAYYHYYYFDRNEYASSLTNRVQRPKSETVSGGYAGVDNDYTANPNIFQFDVEDKKTTDITGKLQIDKTDGKKNLQGAEFMLENVDDPTKYRNIITKETTATIENIPPGKYTLRETLAPDGYVPSKEIWDVSVDLYGNTTITKRGKGSSTVDTISTGNGSIVTNHSTVSKNGISASSTISVTSLDMGQSPAINISSKVPLRLRRISPDSTTVGDTRTGGTNSYTSFENLTEGIYVLETIGILKNADVQYMPAVVTLEVKRTISGYEYIIKEGNANITNNAITLNLDRINPIVGYVNVPNDKNKFTLKKVDFNSRVTPLADAVFELYREENDNGDKSAGIKEKISTGIKTSSNREGMVVFEGLNSTDVYWIKEIVPPTGYDIETEPDGSDKYYGPFVMGRDGIVKNSLDPDADLTELPYTVTNKKKEPRDGKLVIEKQDGTGKPISGAEFTIYLANDQWEKGQPLDETQYELLVDQEKGIYTFDGLKEGKYIIKETKAPGGYVLSKQEMRIQIMADGETKIINRDAFNSNVSNAAVDATVKAVSMYEEPKMAVGAPVNTFVRMAKTFRSLMSGDIAGGTESFVSTLNKDIGLMAMRSIVTQNSDPMELSQLYTTKPNPTAYSTDTGEGVYPTPPSQAYPTVRNSNIPINNLYWYESVYRQPDINEESGYRQRRNLNVAGVNKYAKEVVGNGTDGVSGKIIDGEYEINLKTQGNLVNPDERVDVMIVYDNSNSMGERSPSGKIRFDVAKAATENFVKTVLSKENNPKGYIKMGLVTYGSTIQDGRDDEIYYESGALENRWKSPDYTYDNFTDDPNTIISTLPKETPDQLGHREFGGTYTSGALKFAGDIINDPAKSPKSHKKVIIHVTDGMPTKSLHIDKMDDGSGRTTFYPEDSKTHVIKGDGGNYWLEDYYFNKYSVTYTYSDYYGYSRPHTQTFTGAYEQVLAKYNEVKQYYNGNKYTRHTFPDGRTSNAAYISYYSAITKVGLTDVRDEAPVHATYTTSDGVKINNHGEAAKAIAENLIDDGLEIYNLGIELGNPSTFNGGPPRPRTASKDEALSVLKGMSSQGGKGHYYDAARVEDLTDVFRDIFRKLPQRTVYNAQVTDPMGEMVDLKLPANWKSGRVEENVNGQGTGYYMIYDGTSTGSKSFPAGFENFELTASQNILKDDVRIYYNPTTRTLKMDNFTLSENDWINFKYRVNLRTTDPKFKDNTYYPTNGETYLQPNKDFNMRWKYPVPSVKGPLKSILVEKEWLDYDGAKIKGTSPIRVKLESRLTDRKGTKYSWVDATKVNTREKMTMTLDDTNEWKGRFTNLIAYDDKGSYEYRVVEEAIPTGFDSSIVMKDNKGYIIEGNDTGITGGRGSVKITNTKRRDIVVKKTWKAGDVPAPGTKVKVYLKAYKGDLKTQLTETEISELGLSELVKERVLDDEKSHWETKYTGLPVRMKSSKSDITIPIIYRIEEKGMPGFKVNYDYNPVDGIAGVINYEIPKVGFKNTENKIEFRKVDENGNAINGAVLNLKLQNEAGDLVESNVIPDVKGNIYTFKHLKPGTYQLYESTAPDGFVKPDVVLAEFKVDSEGNIEKPTGKNPVDGKDGEKIDKYLRNYNGVHYIKNFKKEMEFKFQKIEDGVGKIREGILRLKFYKMISGDETQSTEIQGIFEEEYNLAQQDDESFAGFVTKIPTNLESGIYYIKETKAPDGFANDGKEIYIKIDWDKRSIEEIEEPSEDGTIVVKKQLYKFDSNTKNETIGLLDIINRRVALPDAGGIGPHVITLAGLGMMLMTAFIYRRKY